MGEQRAFRRSLPSYADHRSVAPSVESSLNPSRAIPVIKSSYPSTLCYNALSETVVVVLVPLSTAHGSTCARVKHKIRGTIIKERLRHHLLPLPSAPPSVSTRRYLAQVKVVYALRHIVYGIL